MTTLICPNGHRFAVTDEQFLTWVVHHCRKCKKNYHNKNLEVAL